jgi:hypothetical protein
MSGSSRSVLKLPRMQRSSAATIALVAMMFLTALLWVREQHGSNNGNNGKPAQRVAAVHAPA